MCKLLSPGIITEKNGTIVLAHHEKREPGLYLSWIKHNSTTNKHLLVLLGTETSVAVGELDVEGGGALDNSLSLLGRDGVCDLSAIPLVVHEEHIEILQVK